MRDEPLLKRTIAFFDGQNLFHSVKQAFGYPHPNYDPTHLAKRICDTKSWQFAYFGPRRTAISEQAEQSFRSKPNSCFGKPNSYFDVERHTVPV